MKLCEVLKRKLRGKIISTVGCPAVGKTYLAEKLGDILNAEIIYEQPKKGFPDEIKQSLANQVNLFEVIVWFRNHQICNHLNAIKIAQKSNIVVLDTPFFQNQLFVDLYIPDEFKKEILYELGRVDRETFKFPDLIIYISSTSDLVKEFLEKRFGQRDWENSDWFDFIVKMPSIAEKFIRGIQHQIPKFIEIKRGDFDFSKPEDCEKLLIKIDDVIN